MVNKGLLQRIDASLLKKEKKKHLYLKRYKQFCVISANCCTRIHKRLPFRQMPPDRRSACVCESRENQCLFTGANKTNFPYFTKGKQVFSWLISKSSDVLLYKSSFYIYAFSRRFYPMRLTIAFRLYIHFLISMFVSWESNPQPFALLMQCSTTEPHRNTFCNSYS